MAVHCTGLIVINNIDREREKERERKRKRKRKRKRERERVRRLTCVTECLGVAGLLDPDR